ncbi:MAG: CoA pyrophosphatase [Nitrososphaerota archaeon]
MVDTSELKKTYDLSGGVNKAAVVVLYIIERGTPEILFVVRKISENDRWSGQVAFPGGRWEPVDRDLIDTARRELLEETSIDLDSDVEILAILKEVSPSNMPELKVIPFLVRASSKPPINLSEELSTYFWATIGELERVQASIMLPDGSWKSVLGFRKDEWIIWGMTARILEDALPRIIALQ